MDRSEWKWVPPWSNWSMRKAMRSRHPNIAGDVLDDVLATALSAAPTLHGTVPQMSRSELMMPAPLPHGECRDEMTYVAGWNGCLNEARRLNAAPPPPAEQASGYDAPVAATLADAAADPALTMDEARELLADTARAITAGAYAALSQRPVKSQ